MNKLEKQNRLNGGVNFFPFRSESPSIQRESSFEYYLGLYDASIQIHFQ